MVRSRSALTKPFIARELGPGLDVKTDAPLEDYVRRTAVTAHHPAGTCKMGSDADPMAVVDGGLRVYGTSGLRVIDASAFPDLVSGNINAPTITIAERAADSFAKGVRVRLRQPKLPLHRHRAPTGEKEMQ